MSEQERLSGFTLRSFIFSIIFCVISAIVLVYTGYISFYNPVKASASSAWTGPLSGALGAAAKEYNSGLMTYIPILMIFSLLAIIFSMVPAKWRFTKSEMAFIYSMVAATLVWVQGGYIWGQLLMQALSRPSLFLNVLGNMYPIKDTSEMLALANKFRTGGIAINWASWIMPIAITISIFCSMSLLGNFWALILNKIWVEQEDLPFPMSVPISEMINMSSEGIRRLAKEKLLWLGVVLCVAFAFSNWGNPSDPFQNTYRARDIFTIYSTNFGPAYFGIGFSLPELGLILLLPPYVSQSMAIGALIIWTVYPLVATATGFMANKPAPGQWSVFMNDFSPDSPTYRLGLAPAVCGALIGFALWPLIVNWRQLKESLTKSFKQPKNEYGDHKIAWIGMIVCAIWFIAAAIGWGVPLQYTIIVLGSAMLIHTAFARIIAESGGGWYGLIGDPVANIQGGYIGMFVLNQPETVTLPVMTLNVLYTQSYNGMNRNTPMYRINEAYAVGRQMKTRMRDLLLGSTLATIIGVTVTTVLTLWLMGTYGWMQRYPGPWFMWPSYEDPTKGSIQWGMGAVPFNPSIFIWIFGFGTLPVIALYLLRSTVGGIFLQISPVGLWSAAHYTSYITWITYLIGSLIVRLANRIGGREYYEKKIMPLGVGLLLGWGVTWLIRYSIMCWQAFILRMGFP
ncbi:MAG: OPT/YSL family transporter [Nitrososphaerota archaeon]|nr:OPT/YSL family transporter [Candidatus Bathyarchaeota archaeon]MDW8049082.1 OPT/YSL family transporter [Nitrososphaerota archaeon]